MKFNCTGCGLCCTKVREAFENVENMLPADKDAIKSFPYAAKPDGSCEKLVDGKCSVYATRPLICNMERMYYEYYKPQNVPKRDFYNLAALRCNSLILAAGLEQTVKMH